jgi:hypothetical protein
MSYFPPSIDDTTGAMNVIDYAHHEIHEGSTFSLIHATSLVDPATYKWGLTTPNTAIRCHLLIAVTSSGASNWVFYENPATYTGGAAWTAMNRTRNSVTAATLVGLTNVTSTGGTELGIEYIGTAGGGPASPALGGSSRTIGEWILKQNEQYTLWCTTDGADIDVSVAFIWYEHS